MRLINTKFDTYKNHLILSNIYIQNIANGIYPDHLWTITTIWLMARDKLFVTYVFKGGSESGFTAVTWLVRDLHVIISSNFSLPWEPCLTQDAHRKEAELLKYFGLKSSPAWVAFKRECVVLVNLPTERLREKQLPSQPAKELSHPWQTVRWHISPDDGIPQWKRHSDRSWGLSWGLHTAMLLLIPVVTPNVTTHKMPPALSKPQSLSADNYVYYSREKNKAISFPLVSKKWVPLYLSPTWRIPSWISSFYLLWALSH